MRGRKDVENAAAQRELSRALDEARAGIASGGELFGQRAAFIMRYYDTSAEENGIEIDYGTELWFLEDMQFAVVHVMRTEILESETPRHIAEYRKVVTIIEDADDIFFSLEDFLGELDDICMFHTLEHEATIYEL